MERTTRLAADQTRRLDFEEPHHLGSPQLLPEGDLTRSIDAVDLKDALRQVEADGDSLDGGRLLPKWSL